MTKIAHISDLHFSKLTLHPKIFLNKRFIGMVNLFLNRRGKYRTDKLKSLPKLFKDENIDYTLISGDISTTSLDNEFQQGKAFVDSIINHDIKTLVLPGNHDAYTKSAHRQKLFYKYFENEHLKNLGLESKNLKNGWHYIGLDCAVFTSLLASNGHFTKDLEKSLNELLNTLSDKKIIIANHFPANRITSFRKRLKRDTFLKDILKKHSNIKLYVYGHTHKSKITKEDGMPYMINSGCASHINGTFNIFTLENDGVTISKYKWIKDSWEKQNDEKLKI